MTPRGPCPGRPDPRGGPTLDQGLRQVLAKELDDLLLVPVAERNRIQPKQGPEEALTHDQTSSARGSRFLLLA